jgi:hypothetical protein
MWLLNLMFQSNKCLLYMRKYCLLFIELNCPLNLLVYVAKGVMPGCFIKSRDITFFTTFFTTADMACCDWCVTKVL